VSRNVTRADLAAAVAKVAPVNVREAQDLVDEVIEHICRALERGEEVKLSSFATFRVRSKTERIGRNPKTGEEKMISPRTVVSFSASRTMKELVQSRLRSSR
jgi:Bacterial nucleoid DNA-binding protein